MQISELFKQVISDTFYDKEVEIYNTIENVGEELDVVRSRGDLKEKLKCNVHNVGNKVLQQDYGLDIQANIMITCSSTQAVKGDIITYNNIDYMVVEILTCDSHTKIFGDSNGQK